MCDNHENERHVELLQKATVTIYNIVIVIFILICYCCLNLNYRHLCCQWRYFAVTQIIWLVKA